MDDNLQEFQWEISCGNLLHGGQEGALAEEPGPLRNCPRQHTGLCPVWCWGQFQKRLQFSITYITNPKTERRGPGRRSRAPKKLCSLQKRNCNMTTWWWVMQMKNCVMKTQCSPRKLRNFPKKRNNSKHWFLPMMQWLTIWKVKTWSSRKLVKSANAKNEEFERQ